MDRRLLLHRTAGTRILRHVSLGHTRRRKRRVERGDL